MTAVSRNFGFLHPFHPSLCDEATKAEQCFAQLEALDLAATGFRRFAECLTADVLQRSGRPPRLPGERLEQQMDRVRATGRASDQAMAWLHKTRQLGNKGSHAGGGACTTWEIVELMRIIRKLAVWWVGTFHPDAEVVVPGFAVPQTGNKARDERAEARVRAEEAREAALSEAEREAEVRRALRPRVVLHEGLTRAYETLEADAQRALTAGVAALREDPQAGRFVYAPVAESADEKLRLVALDEGLSLVAAVPAHGDVVFALWAGGPADAAAWAASKRVEVHPALGAVQLFDVAEAEEAVAPVEAPDSAAEPLFAAFGDEDIVRLGLPEPLLAAVRAVTDEAAWLRLAVLLPGEAGDALELLLVSGSVDEVVAELKLDAPDEVDTTDFSVAAEHPATKRSFRMLEEDEDLEAALRGTIQAWRLFLHPDQRALVRMHASGPVRVLGGAGTGKTVALLHRAAHLLDEVVLDGRVFVTTFTRNLALDLEQSLGRMIGAEERARADVWNLHRLARKVADLDDRWELLQPDMAHRLWEAAHVYDALGLPVEFYREEWDEIVQANGLANEREYLLTTRTGRGKPLGRRQRRAVWRVLAAFGHLMRERELFEWGDLVRLARARIASGAWVSPYRAVLADEVQDFTPAGLRLLRDLVPRGANDLFLVGDAHQRIYGAQTSMRSCGIEIRGRSRRLRVNYRTTQEIRDWAVATLEGQQFDDLDGGLDTLAGYRSLRAGERPRVVAVGSLEGEELLIRETLDRWLELYPPNEICVTGRTRSTVSHYGDLLREMGHQTVLIRKEEPPGAGIRLATMHRLKGLEFSCVLLCAADDRPPALDVRERCLLYVASTRARDELVIIARTSSTILQDPLGFILGSHDAPPPPHAFGEQPDEPEADPVVSNVVAYAWMSILERDDLACFYQQTDLADVLRACWPRIEGRGERGERCADAMDALWLAITEADVDDAGERVLDDYLPTLRAARERCIRVLEDVE